MKPLALTLVTLLLGASLVGCGGGNKNAPAVCGSVDTLKTSLTDLTKIDITSSGAVSSLETGLANVKTDLDAVKTDGNSQFGPQIQSVEDAYTELQTTATAATTSPSAGTIAAVAAAVTTFVTDTQTLVKDVQATC